MTDTAQGSPIQHIYGHGPMRERSLYVDAPAKDLVRVPTIADLIPVTEIMARDLICARRDLPVRELIELMIAKHVGCVPVIEEPGRPIGMVTKFDLVEQLSAAQSSTEGDLAAKTAGELMMPLAITLGERATIAHAAAMMTLEDVHHVPIVDMQGRLIGLVSSMDIVRWLARNDGFAASR